MSDVDCPYCGESVEIESPFGHDEGETYNTVCPHCDNGFAYDTIITISHDAWKAPCQNGGEHEFHESVGVKWGGRHINGVFTPTRSEYRECKNCPHTEEFNHTNAEPMK